MKVATVLTTITLVLVCLAAAQDEATAPGGAIPPGFDIQPADVDPGLFFGPRPADAERARLGPDDVVEIKVFEMDQFDLRARVSGTGMIDLPLVGLVHVQGLVPAEAADRVADMLRDEFVQNPQVSLFVEEFNAKKLSLIGAVDRPATYPRLGTRSLLQLLADAGGVTEDADDALYIFRETGDGRRARLRVPLRELLIEGDPRWDVWLYPGDVVSVPPREFIPVSVLGAVNRPGIYQLPRREASLLKALASANGLNRRASRKDIEIKRQSGHSDSETIHVNLVELLDRTHDFPLQEGDVVYVNEKFF